MSSTENAAGSESSQADHPPSFVAAAVAALCAAAGVVHLVMVPAHSQDSTLDGVLFLLAGWAQIGIGIGLIAWPRRSLLAGAIAVNAATAAAWVVSRTAGLPWGAHSGQKEAAGTIDQMTTGFEVAAVVLAAVILLRPNLFRAVGDKVVLLGAVVPVAVVVATSVVLTSPDAANHHDTAATPDNTAATLAKANDRCDLAMNPAAYWKDATIAGYDTVSGTTLASAASTGTTPAPAAGGHSHGGAAAAPAAGATTPKPDTLPQINEGRGSAEVDRLMALSTREGEGAEARLVVELSKVSDESYEQWVRRVSTTATHAGPQQWEAMTDTKDCATLEAELDKARDFALAHPTPKEAVAAGYIRVTGYVPGIAAHYINGGYVDDTFEIDKPEMLLYDGTEDNSQMVGLSYLLTMGAPMEPTQGFTGPNDRYHAHIGLCIGAGGVIGDSTTTEEECKGRGGVKSEGDGTWMSHLWVVPGCESPWGIFSGANPLLDWKLGEATGTGEGGCAGSGVRDRYDLSPGDRKNTPAPVNGDAELASP